MRGLANLTGGFIPPFFVGVGGSLGDKNKKQQRQTEGKQPGQAPTYVWPIHHFDFQDTLSPCLTLKPFPSEQYVPFPGSNPFRFPYCTPG